MGKLNDSKYTEFYITNKKEGEQLFFKVDYHINTYEYENKDINFSMEAAVSYLFLIKDNKHQEKARRTNRFVIESIVSHKSCTLKDSILITDEYRSYGIGSFLLNKILSEAAKHIPDYSLTAKLSVVDEREEENRLRRNALYENAGFRIIMDENTNSYINGKIEIDKLSNLKLERKFDYIEIIDFYKIADRLYKLSKENEKLLDEKDKFYRLFNTYKAKNNDLDAKLEKYTRSVVILIGIIFFIFLILYFRYFD
jgi:GNAT superfamily N-acetyltransferase